MTAWEYTTLTLAASATEAAATLEEWGNAGWELAGVVSYTEEVVSFNKANYNKQFIKLFLKRPKQ